MKSIRWGILVGGLLVVLLATAGCGSPSEVALSAADDGRQVVLSRGQGLAIALESNPTAGYRWQVVSLEDKVLTQVGEAEFQAPGSGSDQRVGVGGTGTLRFRAGEAGEATLRLAYQRPWERDEEPVETFEIQVVVR